MLSFKQFVLESSHPLQVGDEVLYIPGWREKSGYVRDYPKEPSGYIVFIKGEYAIVQFPRTGRLRVFRVALERVNPEKLPLQVGDIVTYDLRNNSKPSKFMVQEIDTDVVTISRVRSLRMSLACLHPTGTTLNRHNIQDKYGTELEDI